MSTTQDQDETSQSSSEAAVALRRSLGLYSEDEVAQIVGVGVFTLLSWRREGRGPDFTRLGKKVFYRREDLASWIRANVQVTKRLTG